MVETEEIRFEIGDACCSIVDRGYDVKAGLACRYDSLSLRRRAAGTQNERLGDGPSVRGLAIDAAMVVLSWKDGAIARRATGAPCPSWKSRSRVLDGSAPSARRAGAANRSSFPALI